MKTAIIAITIVFLMISVFIIIMVVLYSRRQKKNKLEKQQLAAEFAQTLLQSQLEIQEQTFQHVSRELHDNLSQVASLIKINLNTIRFDDLEKAKEKTEDTKESLRRLITDLKSLSVGLGSEHISKTGFIKAIELETERLNRMGTLHARLSVDSSGFHIAEDKAIILYRMVQEMLNNVIKHSNAKNLDVIIAGSEKKYTLAICDDGIGFHPAHLSNTTSAGLRNLRNRALLIGAQLQIISEPGKGTKVSIELPQ